MSYRFFYFVVSSVVLSVSVAQSGLHTFFTSKLNLWVTANFALSLTLYCSHSLQKLIFGPLRDEESEECRLVTLNQAVFRIVFMMAILDANDSVEVLLWSAIFTAPVVLRTFIILTQRRFNMGSVFLNVPYDQFRRNLCTVVTIAILDVAWALCVCEVFWEAGATVLCFLLFDTAVLFFECVQAGLKYFIHLRSAAQDDSTQTRDTYVYYSEYALEFCVQLCRIADYLHIWWTHGLACNLIDLFLFLNLRKCYRKLRVKREELHSRIEMIERTRAQYADATGEELAALDDKCAICREDLLTGKKLPCKHIFHLRCLQSWMKYKQVCPICRASLLPPSSQQQQHPQGGANGAGANAAPNSGGGANGGGSGDAAAARVRNGNGDTFADFQFRGLRRENELRGDAVFRFDTRRWARWLPRVSFELRQMLNYRVPPPAPAAAAAAAHAPQQPVGGGVGQHRHHEAEQRNHQD